MSPAAGCVHVCGLQSQNSVLWMDVDQAIAMLSPSSNGDTEKKCAPTYGCGALLGVGCLHNQRRRAGHDQNDETDAEGGRGVRAAGRSESEG